MINIAETKASSSSSSSRRVNEDKAKDKASAPVVATEAPSPSPSMGIAIAKGVALPDGGRSGGSKYPWATMVPGDAFFVPGARIETFYSLTNTEKKKRPYDFITRKCNGSLFDQGDVDGVGVWCLSREA